MSGIFSRITLGDCSLLLYPARLISTNHCDPRFTCYFQVCDPNNPRGKDSTLQEGKKGSPNFPPRKIQAHYSNAVVKALDGVIRIGLHTGRTDKIDFPSI